MSPQSSNTAKQVTESEALGVEEPSMDEILASIKKIISDDEGTEASLQDRDQYSHPTDPSNSNSSDEELGADLEAAIENELLEIASDEVGGEDSNGVEVAADSIDSKPETLEDRAEQIRQQVSAASTGLSPDDKLEKYRVRGKLKMEALAERPAPTVAVPQAAAIAPSVAPTTPAAAVEAGPVLPTTHTIAQHMADTMLAEKEQEIQTLLANIMRPTIHKWLSENLPVMVEKLVREEIERVSRGKQAS